MWIYRLGEMKTPLNASSSGSYESMVASLEKIVTDKLRSYDVARREVAPEVIHDTSQYANRFKSTGRLRGFRVLMPLYQIYLILGGTL